MRISHRNIPHRYACHPSPSEGCGRKSQQSPEACVASPDRPSVCCGGRHQRESEVVTARSHELWDGIVAEVAVTIREYQSVVRRVAQLIEESLVISNEVI